MSDVRASQVLDALRRHAPDAALLDDGVRVCSTRQLLARVEQLAAALRGSGVRLLASQIDNGVDWLVVDLALARIGAVHVPLPTYFSIAQRTHALAASGADHFLGAQRPDPGWQSGMPGGLPCRRLSRDPVPLPDRCDLITFTIQLRAVDQLSPINVEWVPKEIASTVRAVNHLMARLDAALERERRYTADAAHELRTPLAALQVHAENLQRASSAGQRRESSGFLQQGIQRLGRLVEQMRELSRLDPAATQRGFACVSMAEVVRQVLEEQAVVSVAREVELAYESPDGPVRVRGDELLPGLLVRNLVDNAVRYTPADGHVHIRLIQDVDGAELSLEDSGPGIDAEARERVFARFHCELGTGQSGSGLGLSIVRQVAQIHGSSITLARSESLGGLRVSVLLPSG